MNVGRVVEDGWLVEGQELAELLLFAPYWKFCEGSQLAQLVEHATLDLRVMHSSSTLDVEIA